MQARWLELDDCLRQFLIAGQDFRQTKLVLNSEIGGRRRTSQVSIDQECLYAIRLGQKPCEIRTHQCLSFTDTCACHYERMHVLSLAGFQKFGTERTKVFAFRRAWFGYC